MLLISILQIRLHHNCKEMQILLTLDFVKHLSGHGIRAYVLSMRVPLNLVDLQKIRWKSVA